jgi:hypothetical protein
LAEVPSDAFWSWGLYDSLIFVVPSLDRVVARTGRSWPRQPGGAHYDPLRPFVKPIVAAAQRTSRTFLNSPPENREPDNERRTVPAAPATLPRGSLISEARWPPAETIRRAAQRRRQLAVDLGG